MINKYKIAQWIFLVALLYFLVYNSIFGWNLLPENKAEKICDDILRVILWTGFVFYFLPIMDWYAVWVKEFYKQQNK